MSKLETRVERLRLPKISLRSTTKRKSKSKDFAGIGFRYVQAKHTLEFLFEVKNLAMDEHGKHAPAGFILRLGLKPDAVLKTRKEYEEAAAKMAAQGLSDLQFDPHQMRPVTWEYYSTHYNTDED